MRREQVRFVALQKINYTGCAVLIYTDNGDYIRKCEVSSFNRQSYQLKLKNNIPPSLSVGDICSLLILCEPSPREYKGRVVIDKSERLLLLFRGKEKESRRMGRYKVDFESTIISLLRHDEAYQLHTPAAVRVINISRNGIRLSAPTNSLRERDKIHLRVKLEDSDKLLTAMVINELNKNNDVSEYGCALVVS
jgi:hypothetical protein